MVFDKFLLLKRVEIKEGPKYEVGVVLRGEQANRVYNKLIEFGRKDFSIRDGNVVFSKLRKTEYNIQPFILLKDQTGERDDIVIYEFILSGINEARREKYQVSLMVGDKFGYFFFGSLPKMVVIQGFLLNYSNDFDWRESFIKYYEEHLRGTKLIENKYKLYLFYENVYIIGYPLDFTVNYQAKLSELVAFGMNILAIERQKVDIRIFNRIEQAPETGAGGYHTYA